MNETRFEDRFYPGLCFPSDSKFLLFVLFPGQKVFISLYHPFQALPSVELRKFSEMLRRKYFDIFPSSGLAFYNAVVKMKATRRLEGVDNCTASLDDFESLLSVHGAFEKW